MKETNSPRAFLSYWKPATVDLNVTAGRVLNHSSSDQYGRIRPADTVWIASVRHGELILIGRIEVGVVVDHRTAQERLQKYDLWEASHHILAKDGTAVPMQEITISKMAEKLRFVTVPERDKLTLIDGRVDAKQLQTMRILTAASAALLESVLAKHAVKHEGEGRRKQPKRHEPSERAVQTRRVAPNAAAGIRDVLEALAQLQNTALHSPDLLHPDYRGVDRSRLKLNGFCYALSDCMFHLFPGVFDSYRIGWPDGGSHYFLRFRESGAILETIVEGGQPDTGEVRASDYARAKRRQFKDSLSVRGAKLLKRAGLKL